MFNLESIIFNFFGLQAKEDDSNKVNDKGFNQRFQEFLARDLDENEIDLINNLLTNVVDPYTLQDKYVIYREREVGLHLAIYTDLYFRKRLLPLMMRIYDIKGTIPGYVLLFRKAGFDSCTIVESEAAGGFDHPVLELDSQERKFDSQGGIAGFYNVELTGSLVLTDSYKDLIFNIIEFNEPIWANLLKVTYNGDDIENIQTGNKGDFNSDFSSDFFV